MRRSVRALRSFRKAGWVVAAVVLGLTVVAGAGHQFTDVPSSALYHDAVAWLVRRGITQGCAMGLFCPDGLVTRGQMALFMQRLGGALTTRTIYAVDGSTTLDIGPTAYVCATQAYTPTYPQKALLRGNFSLQAPSGHIRFLTRGIYSTNGGIGWLDTLPQWGMLATAHNGEYASTPYSGYVDLNPGTTYRFGVRAVYEGGTTDIAQNYYCAVLVEVVHRVEQTITLGEGPAPVQRGSR